MPPGFQSSPGPRAGRCVPLLTVTVSVAPVFQSSPGPRAGRCSPSGPATMVVVLTVSILARPEGRALLRRCGVHWRLHLVSILARPEGRALHGQEAAAGIALSPFQSSPGPRAGRCDHERTSSRSRLDTFQSSPGPRAGRCHDRTAPEHRAAVVSILARPEGRALRCDAPRRLPLDTEFQSSPGPRAGRCVPTISAAVWPTWMFQSSPGPRAGRCRPADRVELWTTGMFQSSPGPRAGRCDSWLGLSDKVPVVFQSSPGPRAGRCFYAMTRGAGVSLFQSSPGPRAGRCPRLMRLFLRVSGVSILARPEGRALQASSRP